MSFFDRFRSKRDPQETNRLLKDSLEEIIRRVAQQSGIDRCIRFEDDACAVAFSGSKEDPALRLDLSITRSAGWDYLTAELDEGLCWHEWEFEDRFEFFDNMVEYIAKRMNHKVKTVTETVRRQGIRITEYILDEQGEWQIIRDEQVNNRLVGMFIAKTETQEVVKEYHI